MPYRKYIEEINRLGEEVAHAKVVGESRYRSKLCELIGSMPLPVESQARELCLRVVCPPAAELVEHLQHDIDTFGHQPEYAIIFFPLMRVALAVRSGEMHQQRSAPR